MIAVLLAGVLAVAWADSARVPGTDIRFGMESGRFGATQGFTPGTRTVPSDTQEREGPVRFFGIDSQVRLVFVKRRLAEAEFLIEQASPHQISYIEDDLRRRGYRRGCERLEPAARICTWTGRTVVKLSIESGRVMARVLPLSHVPDARSAVPRPAAKDLDPRIAAFIARSDSAAGRTRATPDTGAAVTPEESADGVGTTQHSDAAHGEEGVTAEDVSPTVALYADTLQLDAGNLRPRFVEQPGRPAYPAAAREAGVQGIVRTIALVDTNGVVMDVSIVRSIPELDTAARNAVRGYRFRPITVNGKAVRVRVAVPVTFTLYP